MQRQRTKKFRARATRLIEQEAYFWFDVHESMSGEDVLDYAADIAEEVADGIWCNSDIKPDKVTVETIEPTDEKE